MAERVRIGDLLVEGGVITREQLSDALRYQAQAGGRLGTNLVELGMVDEKTLASALARQLSIPSVTQAQLDKISDDVLRLVPGPLASRLGLVPLRFDAGRLWVAMSDPTDQDALGEISRLTKKPVRATVAPDMLIQLALEKYYKVPRRPRREVPRPGGGAAPSVQVMLEEEVMLDEADLSTGYLDEEVRPEPVLPAGGPTVTMSRLLEQLSVSGTDEVVLDSVMRYLSPGVRRIAVLVLKNGELQGWLGHNLDQATLQRARAALADLPVFQRALESGQAFVGRIESWTLGALASPLGLVGDALGLVVPVRVGRQPVGVIVGLDTSLDVMRRKPELDKLALKIDHALHINYLKRLLLQP